jgi:hypothetical protein
MKRVEFLLLIGVSIFNGVSAADVEVMGTTSADAAGYALKEEDDLAESLKLLFGEAVTDPSASEGAGVDTLVETLKSLSFDLQSEDVGEAYRFFSGQNILNAKDVDYRQWYIDGNTNKEMLYRLYLALIGFLSEDGTKFVPDDLNDGFTHKNYEFLKKVFG